MARILVIDDDDELLKILQKRLVKAGYEVLTASDGSEGINLYHKKRPDVVITDIIMPVKDGTEVILELQKIFPDIKMIVMTGGGQGDAENYLESIKLCTDVKYTLKKPFAMDELLKVVKKCMG